MGMSLRVIRFQCTIAMSKLKSSGTDIVWSESNIVVLRAVFLMCFVEKEACTLHGALWAPSA